MPKARILYFENCVIGGSVNDIILPQYYIPEGKIFVIYPALILFSIDPRSVGIHVKRATFHQYISTSGLQYCYNTSCNTAFLSRVTAIARTECVTFLYFIPISGVSWCVSRCRAVLNNEPRIRISKNPSVI